MIYKPFVTYIL